MTGILKQHGTNPSLFGNIPLSFDEAAWDNAGDTVITARSTWVDIEDATQNATNPSSYEDSDVVAESEHDFLVEPDDRPFDKYDVMAERYELGDDNYTTVDDYVEHEVVSCTLNGEEISPEDAEDLFYGMIFGSYVTSSDDSAPNFCGADRTNVGQIGWWELDEKFHKAWINRRRGAGIDRAPKWQKHAGGRRKALMSIKHLPIEETAPLDFSEVLEAHDAVMH